MKSNSDLPCKESVRKFVAFTEQNEFYDIVLIIHFLDRFVSKSIEKNHQRSLLSHCFE